MTERPPQAPRVGILDNPIVQDILSSPNSLEEDYRDMDISPFVLRAAFGIKAVRGGELVAAAELLATWLSTTNTTPEETLVRNEILSCVEFSQHGQALWIEMNKYMHEVMGRNEEQLERCKRELEQHGWHL